MSVATSRAPLTFRFSLMSGIDPASFKQENQIAVLFRACAADYTAGPAPARRSLSDVSMARNSTSSSTLGLSRATFGRVMTLLLDDQVCSQVYIPRGVPPRLPAS
jgi:hypothetical protein